jgi:hypothetical protein
MDWNLYWTIILQVGVACIVLFWPLSVVTHFITTAITSGYYDAKKSAKAKKNSQQVSAL